MSYTNVPDFRLFQNGYDLAVSKFRCFHAESPAHILRENSTFDSYYFRGHYRRKYFINIFFPKFMTLVESYFLIRYLYR